MAMERRSSLAALLLLTLVFAATTTSSRAAVEETTKQCNPLAAADEQQGYMLVGIETGGGDKIRVVVVAGQRYFFITGYAKGWFQPPRWSFRDGERGRLLTKLGTTGASSCHGGGASSSHAEVVASNVLAAMMNDGKA